MKHEVVISKEQETLWIKFENHCKNEGIGSNRLLKLKNMYHVICRGIKANFEKATREDIELFINALNNNQFKKLDNELYKGNSKRDIKKFIKQFWKWLKGNNELYPKEVIWIKTKIAKEEKPIEKEVISIDDITKLANSFDRIEYKILTLMLFDSGFRISEMLSVKKKNLTWEDYEGIKKCFWLKCNVSKTYVRKIPIPLFTEDIQAFTNSTNFKEMKDDDLLFNKEYRIVHKTLNLKAKEVLKRKISPHIFRHSSATYYARELEGNTLQLATRYGWSLGSDELKTYVRLSGSYEKSSAKKVYENETGKLKQEVAELKEQLKNQKQFIMEEVAKMIASKKK